MTLCTSLASRSLLMNYLQYLCKAGNVKYAARSAQNFVSCIMVSIASLLNLDSTFGALLLGSYLGTMLYGLTTHQTYRYFRLYPGDGRKLKGMVVFLWLSDTLHTTLALHSCYFYLVSNYAQPLALETAVWSFKLLVGVAGIVIMGSHLFYTRRVYFLGNRNVLLTAILCILAVVKLVINAGIIAEAFILRFFDRYVKYTWIIATSFALGVTSDALITISLCLFLHRSRTGYRKTDSLIDIMIVYTVNTGLLTCFVTFCALICIAVMPNNLIYFAIYIIVPKTHTNALLAVLNSRRSLQDRGAEGFETGSFGLRNIADRRNSIQWETPAIPLKVSTKPAVIDVVVTTETFHRIDEESQRGHGDDKFTALHESNNG